MSESKCQDCFNFDCSWHKHFKPVENWTATPTTIKEVHSNKYVEVASYKVTYCPLYKDRGRGIIPIKKCELERVLKIERIEKPKQFDKAEKLCRRIGYKLVRDNEDKQRNYNYYLIPIGAEQ